MKYLLNWWERNGYDDSDWYAAWYNSDTNSIEVEEIGSTRYGGGIRMPQYPHMDSAPNDVYAAFRTLIIERCATLIHNGIVQSHNEPQPTDIKCPPAYSGTALTTIRTVKSRKDGTIPAGLSGFAIWQGAYGQFYKNGYNHPNRANTRVGLELRGEDNESLVIWVALNALKLYGDPESYESVKERIARSFDQGTLSIAPLVGCRAWFTDEYWRRKGDTL